MPYNWVTIHSSTAPQRREQIRGICGKHDYAGADLVGNHVFKDDNGQLYALVKLPHDAAAHDRFLDEIGRAPGVELRLQDTDGN
jgi:hypothetical protein